MVSLIKLLLVLLLGWIGFILFKKFINPTEGNKTNSDSGQKMVACEVCETHIPESEAIIKNGKIYCSKEHSE